MVGRFTSRPATTAGPVVDVEDAGRWRPHPLESLTAALEPVVDVEDAGRWRPVAWLRLPEKLRRRRPIANAKARSRRGRCSVAHGPLPQVEAAIMFPTSWSSGVRRRQNRRDDLSTC
jgi:hypothetical protein